ncbi:hypothetical protein [Pseudomonas turukhanskensis]|uniref:Uncharacterized protein n=1 Tax=Pseudomonas turukhanskensis TaxID=1806536 RepID=A0A9W6K5W1_9PSED|nr:hypothetical protein [Pseudomonas turukhanskensis]GLK88836.1 hypothetical protein GCM10017655_18980 [Pseudomonas turukhanskensis]
MKIRAVVALVLFTAIGAFVLGTRMGATGHVQADAKFIASLTTTKLKDLESGNLERLREALEFDRDLALIRHGEGENGLSIYLWPEMVAGEYKAIGQRGLARAATYRKEHPTKWAEPETLDSLDSDTRRGLEENARMLERVTAEYAQ